MRRKPNKGIPQKKGGGAHKSPPAKSNRKQQKNKQALSAEERLILNALKRRGKGEAAMSSRTLMREAGVKNKTVFYGALRHLERIGDVQVDAKHRVRYVSPEKDVQATLVSLSPGFGFARPKLGTEDVFIHGSELKGAFLGDEILLADVVKQEKGLSGRVKRITQRSKLPVTGTVRLHQEGAYLEPDGALRYNFKIAPGDLKGAKDGDKVTVKPKADHRGDWTYAAVQTVFGRGDSARVCADAIIERMGIPNIFTPAVLEQAEAIGTKITEKELENRLDLRKKAILTIDGADAKDLDDAISVEKTKTGFKLGVHIADVSHYVRENTALDQEAFARGTSVYFADRVIPMLPEAISNGVCSLNAGTDKLTFSAIMHFTKDGEMTKLDFKKSVIHSKVRGVYSEVNEIFSGAASKELLRKYSTVKTTLENARTLANILKARSKSRGEMELESGEIRFVLNEEGVCVDLQRRSTGEAEELIEQMMIAANTAASKFAQRNELPFLYRVHDKPQPDRVTELYTLLSGLGIPAAELQHGNAKTEDFRAVLERVKGTKQEELVSQRILRTMEKAKYAAEETGHYGLALQDYSHFTSPIRRYPDLSIHRILTALLSGMGHEEILRRYRNFAEEAAGESSKNEVRAVSAERAAEDCYVAEYMQGHIGERHVGIISGAAGRGIFVRLKNGAEGFVSFSAFENAEFEFDGLITCRDRRAGRVLMLGDELAIVVASSEVSSGRVDFVPDMPEKEI